MSEQKSQHPLAAAAALTIAVSLAYFLVFPTPEKHYQGFVDGFLLGWFHGAFAPHNWLISQFEELRLVKATSGSTVYGFFWWIGLISTISQLIKTAFRVLIHFKRD